MAMYVQLNGADESVVILRASGGYSPDVMDDLCNRALEMFAEAQDIQWPDGLAAAGKAALEASTDEDDDE